MSAAVGLSKEAVAGHIKRAADLNARRVSTRSIFNNRVLRLPAIVLLNTSLNVKPARMSVKRSILNLWRNQ